MIDIKNFSNDRILELLEYLDHEERLEALVYLSSLDKREYYQKHPIEWMVDVLNIDRRTIQWSLYDGYEDHDWDGTKDPIKAIMDSLAAGKHVAVESCTGSGKSYIAAALVLWFLDCWPKTSLVLTPCPTRSQLDNVWKHIEEHFENGFKQRHPQAQLMSASHRLRMHGEKSNKKASWIARGFVTEVGADEEVAGNARGIHAPDMLIIFDEANSIDTGIVKGLELTCTDPHNLRLYLGNPDNENDSLHQRFILDDVESITISAYDHPNVVSQDGLISGATSESFIDSIISQCSIGGKDYEQEAEYISRVRGRCPIVSSKGLVPGAALHEVRKWFDTEYYEYINNSLDYSRKVHSVEGNPLLQGETIIYDLPDPDETWYYRYIISCDVAGSSGKGDFHAAVVYDRYLKEIAATIHMKGMPNDYVDEIARVAEIFKIYTGEMKYHYPYLVWETNGVGQLIGYEKIRFYPIETKYYRTNIRSQNPKIKDYPGWWTGSAEREEMVDRIEKWGAELINYPNRVKDPILFGELQTLVYNEKRNRYEAQSGFYDDLGFSALGIALCVDMVLHNRGLKPFKTESPAPRRPRSINIRKSAPRGSFDNIRLPTAL